jgi:UDP-N-acetylmuramoyl-tripeptide--D-alanyl-D-alanine ligase
MRFEIIRIGEGIKIFNDCYNANPISMREALKTFAGLTRSRNSTLILGDMLELGESSRDMHYELGKQAASIHRGKLLAVGRYAHDVLEGAIEHGLEKEKTFAVSSAEDAAEMVPHLVGKGQWAMIKGSRGMHMEKVVERLKEVVGKD